MRSGGTPAPPLVRQALLTAAIMMAWQWAGKTTRDSLFLSVFPPSALPAMMGGAALSALLMAALNAALLRRFGPARVIPVGYLIGTVLHAAEWALLPDFPRSVAIAVYIHVVALGSVLLSGFWALANEQFDPREARRYFSQIAAAGTVGTLAGGVMAERVAALTSTQSLLVLLGVLQLACAVALFRFAPRGEAPRHSEAPSIPEVISGAPYLLGLAALVMLAAMSASTLDFLFKAQAAARFARGAPLTRFFAMFNTATSVLTFAVQVGFSRMWLKRFGPGRTVAVLPMAITGASLASIFAPGLVALTISRAIEILLRGSVYRSGYELFYAPMPEAEKRSTKSVIDIGAERLGDGLAGASVQLLLALPAQAVSVAILGFTAALSAVGVWLALRLDRVYVRVLERGLAHHSVNAPPADDPYSQSNVLSTGYSIGASASGVPALVRAPAAVPAPPLADPVLRTLAELRSGNPARILTALQGTDPLAAVLVPQVIELLDRDDVAQAAYLALRHTGDRIAGQLVDALQNPASTYNVRKRIPKVLASFQSRLAWDGLVAHLLDERFEVRTRCAKALEKMLVNRPEYRPNQAFIFDVVHRELAKAQKLAGVNTGGEPARREKALKERAAKSMAHIFTLLGLALPPKPVRLAFRALQAEGGRLKGVALEYLDSILPRSLREELTAYFEGSLTAPSGALTEEAVAMLVDSNPSMMHRIEYWVDAANPSKKDESVKKEG
jgi:AAA family ATP:ADP antiporter